MTSYPFVRRTLATLRIAEFGFLGVRVMTWMQTPRRKGEPSKAGDLVLLLSLFRPLRTNWLIVGISRKSFLPHPNREKGARIIREVLSCATSIWRRLRMLVS